MKKLSLFSSFYIVLFFILLGFQACTNTPQTESTNTETQTAPIHEPSSEEKMKGDYFVATIGGMEKIFYIQREGSNVSSLYRVTESNNTSLFRMERLANAQTEEKFYLQLHNFRIEDQKMPWEVRNDKEAKPAKILKASYQTTNSQGEKIAYNNTNTDKFIVIINKIENDVVEGTFNGELNGGSLGGTVNVENGRFRITIKREMIEGKKKA